MSYRTLLVGLADPDTAPRVMDAATALAREHEAHLIVVHVVPTHVTHEQGLPVADAAERLRAVYEERRDEDAFTSEWRTVDNSLLSPAGALIELGNACDAIVLGQRHGREAGRSHRHLGEYLIGMIARPLLLVPDLPGSDFAKGRMLVAWDGGAVATRAVFDALPFLQHAASVHLHRFNPPKDERRHVVGIAESLGATLARHGVSLELSHSDVHREEIGKAIIEASDAMEATSIVMGGQVHGRLREFLLGGTTRHVLEYATCPVLLGG